MVAVFFILITSLAFITFITLRLLSSRVRVIRIQRPDNLRNKRCWWGGHITSGNFVIVMEELAKPNLVVPGCWAFLDFEAWELCRHVHIKELLLHFICLLQFASLCTLPQRKGIN